VSSLAVRSTSTKSRYRFFGGPSFSCIIGAKLHRKIDYDHPLNEKNTHTQNNKTTPTPTNKIMIGRISTFL
jgi:hypothetical protein